MRRVVCLILLVLVVMLLSAMPGTSLTAVPSPVRRIACMNVDPKGFSWMLEQSDEEASPNWRAEYPLGERTADPVPDSDLAGLILPHHDLANPMISRILAETAERLAGNMPDTIILLGPNHEREGASKIQTNALDWDTPEGIMPVAKDWAEELLRLYSASGDPTLFEREHSVNTLIPWIRHYFPDASVLPILIHGNLEQMRCLALSRTLAEFSNQRKTLIIASIDFSHGLSSRVALLRDAKTWALMQAGDVAGLMLLGNAYLDAPPTLATLLMTMDRLGTAPACLVGHAEASAFLGHPVMETTSYLSVAFPISVIASATD